MDNAEDIIEALLTPPRFKPGEVPKCAAALKEALESPDASAEVSVEWGPSDEWSDDPYISGTMNGKEQEAAIYLGHVRTGRGPVRPPNTANRYCWVITHALHRAINHDPELIVMSARMKKLMLED